MGLGYKVDFWLAIIWLLSLVVDVIGMGMGEEPTWFLVLCPTFTLFFVCFINYLNGKLKDMNK